MDFGMHVLLTGSIQKQDEAKIQEILPYFDVRESARGDVLPEVAAAGRADLVERFMPGVSFPHIERALTRAVEAQQPEVFDVLARHAQLTAAHFSNALSVSREKNGADAEMTRRIQAKIDAVPASAPAAAKAKSAFSL